LTTNLGGQLQEFRKEKKEIFQDRTDKEGIWTLCNTWKIFTNLTS
jgi:hypothetical protein